MPLRFRAAVLRGICIGTAMLPWLAAMYAFYWLDTSGTWTSATAHRGKLSVLLLASGILLSFLSWTFLSRRYVK